AMAQSSCAMLRALGLWGELSKTAQPILEIKITDGRAGHGPSPFVLEFDQAEIEEGPMGHMVEDRHLRPVLLAALDAEPRITQLSGQTITAQSTGPLAASVTLGSGQTVVGALLIGCDGRGSGVARRARIRHIGWDYGQTGLVAAIAHDLPHHGIAHQ